MILEEIEKAAKIVKVIIAGNLLSMELRRKEEEADKKMLRKPWEKKSRNLTVNAIRKAD